MKKEQQLIPTKPVRPEKAPARLGVKTKIRAGRLVTVDPPEPD